MTVSVDPIRVLVGCEKSGIVRDAFLRHGHDAWSCDIQPADRPSNRHIQGDIRDQLNSGYWDMILVMHPPCTRLCNSGVRWLHKPPAGRTLDEMWAELDAGAALFSQCWNADCPHVAVENPVMHKYANERIVNYAPHSFSAQPWQFAQSADSVDNQKKRTCFWRRSLPALEPTGKVDGKCAKQSVFFASPSPDRGDIRSKFFPGMADAMAAQWGMHVSRATHGSKAA